MKKVIILLLIAAIGLSSIGFAHAAVTDAQDELLVYPTVELGDNSVMESLAAVMDFTCGDHLTWHTRYDFATGEAKTDFIYDRKGRPATPYTTRNDFSFYLSGGVGASTSSGSFELGNTVYRKLLQAVADVTPAGETRSLELKMADYADYYLPDYQLEYWSSKGFASQGSSAWEVLTQENWYHGGGAYTALNQKFRFPVQEDQTVQVGITKDQGGSICGVEYYLEYGPELRFATDLNDEGLWFVPIFLDENGAPLPYESPEGHGIYFMPWRIDSSWSSSYEGKSVPGLMPNLNLLELLVPLPEDVPILKMTIDAEAGTALNQKFRFPVQEDQTVQVGITKDQGGMICGVEYYLDYGPELRFATDLNDEGLWFVPIFLDENGAPLPYESPEGHGIYFMPWRIDSSWSSSYEGKSVPGLMPNLNLLELLIPLPEDVPILKMTIDAEAGTALILTREDSAYVLAAYDLTTGAEQRLEVLPFDSGMHPYAHFVRDKNHLLVTAQERLALVDLDTFTLLLTAPDFTGQTYSAEAFDPDRGSHRFEDGVLMLVNNGKYYDNNAFWIAAFRQDETLYYGEYECSIMSGNDNFYYSMIFTGAEYPDRLDPVILLE